MLRLESFDAFSLDETHGSDYLIKNFIKVELYNR